MWKNLHIPSNCLFTSGPRPGYIGNIQGHGFALILVKIALSYITILGLLAGTCTSFSLLPQLLKIIKEKKVEDLSMKMFATLLTGVVLWCVYGFLKHDMPIIITNLFSVALNCCILVLKFRYARKK